MLLIREEARRLTIEEPPKKGLRFLSGALLALAVVPLGLVVAMLVASGPKVTFQCDRAQNSCSSAGSFHGDGKWTLSEVTGAEAQEADESLLGGGTCLELTLQGRRRVPLADACSHDEKSEREYRRAAEQITAFARGSEPQLTTTFRFRPSAHEVTPLAIAAGLLVAAGFVIALFTRTRQLIFSRVAGTLIVSRRAFLLGGKSETIPMSELVSVDPRSGPVSTKPHAPKAHEVLVRRRDGAPIVVYGSDTRDSEYERAERAVAMIVGAPINRPSQA